MKKVPFSPLHIICSKSQGYNKLSPYHDNGVRTKPLSELYTLTIKKGRRMASEIKSSCFMRENTSNIHVVRWVSRGVCPSGIKILVGFC